MKCRAKITSPVRLMIVLVTISACPANSAAFGYHLDNGIFSGFFANSNYWDPYTEEFDRDEAFAVTSVHAELAVESGSWYSGYFSGAIDWIHDFTPATENDISPELLNAYINIESGRATADIGKQPFLIGRGLILDRDEPGIHASWNAKGNRYMEFRAAIVEDSSPLISLTAGYRPGFLEKFELFGIYMRDEDDGFADLLNRQIGIDLYSGTGDLFWVGLAVDRFIGDVYLSGIGIFQTGTMHVSSPGTRDAYDISAWLIDMEGSLNFTPDFSGSVFLFAASGDRNTGDSNFDAFVSPDPYNSRADIFFNGGADGHDLHDGFSLAGIRPPGVLAPGLSLAFQPGTKWLFELSATALFPQNLPDGRKRWYGWETDITATHTWGEDNTFYALVGILVPGGFFETPGGLKPDAIINGMIGVNIFF